MPTKEELKELQSKPLEEKIQISTARIIEWYETWGGQVYVSFSGGKDSTVLLDLVRRIYPEVPAVFVDTGLEFPELRKFVKSIDNVVWLKPKMNFVEILTKYGYPLISKEVCARLSQYRNAITKNRLEKCLAYQEFNGIRLNNNGNYSHFNKEKYKFLLNVNFLCTNKCCDIMKKYPSKEYEKNTHKKPFVGTMTHESNARKKAWTDHGCNAFNSVRPISTPIAFWNEQDILQYIKKYNLSYASVYGNLIEINNKLFFTGEQRTGCMFCGFGCHLEKSPNRFQRMAQTHPKLYDYCMRGGKFDETGHWVPDKGLGMAKVLDAINVQWWNTEEQRDKYRKEYQEKEKKYYNKSEEQ